MVGKNVQKMRAEKELLKQMTNHYCARKGSGSKIMGKTMRSVEHENLCTLLTDVPSFYL